MSEKVNPFAQKSAEKTENSAPKIGEIVPKSETKSAKISAKNQNLNQVQNDVFAQNQTQSPQNPNQFAPNFAEKPKKSRKKLIIILSSVGGFLILALAAFLIWWFAFFDNDKAILDGALSNLIESKYGTIDAEFKLSGSQDLTVKAQIAGDEKSGRMSLTFNAAGISAKVDGFFTEGAIYLKINDLKETIAKISAMSGANSAEISSQLSPIISQIDNKWIKISSDDLTNLSKTFGINANYNFDALIKCDEKNQSYLTKDKNSRDKILAEFSNFYTIKRVATDEFGAKYELFINGNAIERDVAKAVKKVVDLSNYDEYYDCLNDAGFSVENPFTEENLGKMLKNASNKTLSSSYSSEYGAGEPAPIYLWVDRGSREIRRLEVSGSMKENESTRMILAMEINYDQPEDLAAPKNFTTLTNLIKDLQNLTGANLQNAENAEINSLIDSAESDLMNCDSTSVSGAINCL